MLAPDIARIINRGELVVALHKNNTPPFVDEKNGKLVGVDIDIVERVGRELKVPVRYDRSSNTYDEVTELVAAGKADLGVSKLARTLKRAQSVLFSTPYMNLEHALLMNRLGFAEMAEQKTMAKAVKTFDGKIGVLAGSAWVEFAKRNFPQAVVVPYLTWPEAVNAAKTGQVVAAYRDAVEVRKIMLTDPTLAITLRTVTFNDLHSLLCVMVGSRDTVLLSFVNDIVAGQTAKLTSSELINKMKAEQHEHK
jgi:ABC-type amino acid transport substrate-binding protein